MVTVVKNRLHTITTVDFAATILGSIHLSLTALYRKRPYKRAPRASISVNLMSKAPLGSIINPRMSVTIPAAKETVGPYSIPIDARAINANDIFR